MDRMKFIELINRYIKDGWEWVEIELKNGSIIVYNFKNMSHLCFLSSVKIFGAGTNVTFKYKNVLGVVI